MKMELRLREALEKNWFHLDYQPQFALNGELMGMEALLRLKPPEEKTIPPTKFIHVAEESGLIVHIGAWALRQACRQGTAWNEQGYAPFRMAVNVSARQLVKPARSERQKTFANGPSCHVFLNQRAPAAFGEIRSAS
jgi:EAL domain-containing protein (putative c-di-GMP-specific phosphodiesterase class I)